MNIDHAYHSCIAASNHIKVFQTAIEEALWKAFVPTAGYIELSCTILIVYEYLLTIDMERRAIWSRKMSAPTVLFYVNRYTLLVFGLALVLWGLVVWDKDSPSCIAPAVMQTVASIVMEACYVAFSALRIHAINNYRWFWTVLIILLGSIPFPINLADLIEERYLTLQPILLGCEVAKTSGITLDDPVWQRGIWGMAVKKVDHLVSDGRNRRRGKEDIHGCLVGLSPLARRDNFLLPVSSDPYIDHGHRCQASYLFRAHQLHVSRRLRFSQSRRGASIEVDCSSPGSCLSR
ncbi:hypothetical protein PYCCODRAFT_196323 [Trametes coccinea BRFM310]|uniref:DUF6533 domain-containing protein n=1 Tax=Trametes coccinea (strain BRFM310) TaxID=1353009 RepID=A0A1Y2IRL2_TRAC3|nr:hypothetical protein PYCCODRAFT_196323 [Trametes coccinea BRFM310]